MLSSPTRTPALPASRFSFSITSYKNSPARLAALRSLVVTSVEQRNFEAYTPPYIVDAPVAMDVHIVPSAEKPTGCGEPPVPVISPAVVNALAQLTDSAGK
jgi:hypothetical protein